MLQFLEGESPHPYRVPWRVDRVHDSHPLITHRGTEPADFVRMFRSDGPDEYWGRVVPGDTAELCLCDGDLDSLTITLSWFRAGTDLEYVWRFVV